MISVLALAIGCGTLAEINGEGSIYTATAVGTGPDCGETRNGVVRCLQFESCLDAATHTCQGQLCEGPYERYDAFDGIACPIHGGACFVGDLCDPDQRGCIQSHSRCTGDFSD